LISFERYADRKKRLQSISQKQENDTIINNMKQQISINQTIDDVMS
jgi:hypothetical protein